MSTHVTVTHLPDCDFCAELGIRRKAQYDTPTRMGPWANMCEQHFQQYGVGLGTGRGQKLVLRKELNGLGCLCGSDLVSDEFFSAVAAVTIYLRADVLYKREAHRALTFLTKLPQFRSIDIAETMDGKGGDEIVDAYNEAFEAIVLAETDWTWKPFIDRGGAKGFKDANGRLVFAGEAYGMYPLYETAELLRESVQEHEEEA